MDFIQRLKQEHLELSYKTNALSDFMDSDKFLSIKETQKTLLKIQLFTMLGYLSCLNARIKDLETI